jgi:hypothetical protein
MNWSVYLYQLALTLASIPAIAAIVWFIGKRIIDRWFKAREQAYEQELKIASQRDNIRFSKLHEDRAQVIKELYTKLVDFRNSGSMHMIVPKDAGFKKLFYEHFTELTSYFQRHKIYFSEPVCELIDKLSVEMQIAVSDQYVQQAREAKGEQLQKEDLDKKWPVIQKMLPDLLKQIEKEFRQLLGVDEK